uniref:Ribonuclease P/MRP protein subunit POP5 n=1 Tax=Latimeria chalumnae TaxID=7897 RepID=H3BFM9_LATCH
MVRFKSRYLLCEIVFENPLDRQNVEEKSVYRNVMRAITRIHGDFGAGCCANLSVKYLNAYTGIVLLRCRKAFYRLMWSALPFLTELENRSQRYPCLFNTLHVGGTIRTCQKFLIQYNRRQLLQLLQKCQSDEERESVRKSVLHCSLKILEENTNVEEATALE